MRILLTTFIGILLLFSGCRGSNQKEWDALSARVHEYASKNGGQVVRTNGMPAKHQWKRWVIVVPTDSIAQEKLFHYSEELLATVSRGRDGLQWTGRGGSKDPKVYNRDDGSFGTASGPAPVWESDVRGEDVSVRLTVTGLAKATNGSHYDRIVTTSDPPATELLFELDLMVMK